ncbi:PIN-like domain-containing protein [Oceanibaculum nanhaiense]|uniref:PIN-like domain-containing protein n=1 Tax=Oceanibaculum nanhaiense TaxID=1909734 RepID=UPI001593E3E5|nr:hypothetical protein [Oceanibaculum nanhaiense]
MAKLTFYFDRCFGKRLPEFLERANPPFSVEHQHNKRNRFPQDMTDDAWLKICGERGWVAFTHDSKFQHLEVEALAIKQHKVAGFAIWGAQMPTWDKVCLFVRGYPKMMEIIKSEKPPYLYRLRSNARLEKVNLR